MKLARLAAALLVGLGLVACSDGAGAPAGSPVPEPAPLETTTTRPPLKYVSLGDSYPAGEGLPRPVQPCGRTPGAYPSLVVERARLVGSLHACNGATTADILTQERAPGVGPQIQAVTPDADVVTISIGGNDLGFAQIMTDCVLAQLSCTRFDAQVDGALATLGPRLVTIYTAIRTRAPRARLLVVGYPQLVVDPEKTQATTCAGLTPDESRWVRQKGDDLARVIRTAAEVTGARYLDAAERFAGHEACTAEPWMEGLNFVDIVASFHPNAAGHEQLARLVAQALPDQ